jgi:hypothetical protein
VQDQLGRDQIESINQSARDRLKIEAEDYAGDQLVSPLSMKVVCSQGKIFQRIGCNSAARVVTLRMES